MNEINPLSTRFETFEGLRIRVMEGGAGDAVILLPGWPQSLHCWRKVMPLLTPRHRVIAIDPPGIGYSDPLPHGSDTRAVAEFLHRLLDSMGERRFFLVGHDIGTWIGYALAALHPETVRRLVVIDALAPGLAPPQGYAFEKERIVKNWHFFFNALPELPEILIKGREREYLRFLLRTRSANFAKTFTEADVEEYARAYAREGAMSAGFSYYRSIFESASQNLAFATSSLKMPVLAIGGELWMGAVMKPMFERVAQDVTGAVIPDCGHFVPEEAPEALAALILDFVAADGR